MIGNDLFAHFSSTESKSRENYLRILRGQHEDFVLNEYAHSYLLAQQLPQRHLDQLQFDPVIRIATEAEWQGYLQSLGITSIRGVKLLTEAALIGSAIEHGLSPNLVILSDGAGQFNLLVHALCWVHMERGIRRLPGRTARHGQQIQSVQDVLWEYYRQLRHYQDHPEPTAKQRLSQRFDEIFGQRYPRHYGLNLATAAVLCA